MQYATVLEVFDLDIGVQSELNFELFARVRGNVDLLAHFDVLVQIDCEFFITG